jgi:hypothetical protein
MILENMKWQTINGDYSALCKFYLKVLQIAKNALYWIDLGCKALRRLSL